MRAWQPTPVFLPGESNGQRSLAGYSPQGREESDTAEWLSTAQHSLHGFSSPSRLPRFQQPQPAGRRDVAPKTCPISHPHPLESTHSCTRTHTGRSATHTYTPQGSTSRSLGTGDPSHGRGQCEGLQLHSCHGSLPHPRHRAPWVWPFCCLSEKTSQGQTAQHSVIGSCPQGRRGR